MTKPNIFNHAIFNGQLMPVNQAQISVFNPAFSASFGVYESIKIDQGRPFYLQEHLRRLHQSAELINLEINVDAATLADWVRRLIQLDPAATWSLRILALGATEPTDSPIVAMQPTPLPTYAPHLYQTGAAAILYEGQRIIPACKSLNTLVNYLARRQARQTGALEGLLHHHGCLTEGARTNLFAVRHGQIITPPTAEVLSGITRDVILQVMAAAGAPVTEAPVPVDISLYDEFFISSTSMHVMPITSIAGQPVGNGQVGPVTQTVMAHFNAHYQDYMRRLTAGMLS